MIDQEQNSARAYRVGIDCRLSSLAHSGIARYTSELVKRIVELDTRNAYVLFFNSPEYQQVRFHGANVREVFVDAPCYSLSEQTKLLEAIHRENIDLMHFTHFNAPILYRRPSIVTIHDLTLHRYRGKRKTGLLHRGAYRLVVGAAVRHAKRVIAVSENTKREVVSVLRVPEAKVRVVYEGVDDKFGSPRDESVVRHVRGKFGIDKSYLLHTGLLRSHKNLPTLLTAFANLKRRNQFDGLLVLVGRVDAVHDSDLIRQVTSLGLEHDVIFTGFVSDDELVALYSGALVYVFPSLSEGFGLPVLEAMRSGVPVAVSRTSCLPEVCGVGNAAYFDPNDPLDMAEQLHRVISEQELRGELIRRGMDRSHQFSWARMVEQTLQIYEEVLSEQLRSVSARTTQLLSQPIKGWRWALGGSRK